MKIEFLGEEVEIISLSPDQLSQFLVTGQRYGTIDLHKIILMLVQELKEKTGIEE